MTSERKSAFILGGIAAIECGWVIWNLRLNGWRLFRYLGFAPGLTGAIPGWIAAAVVVVIFVGFSLRLPSVRANLFRPSFLKFLAVLVAIGAGILEEVMFRRWTMNWLMAHGHGAIVQVLGAGFLFGLLHAVWGLMGRSVHIAAGAMVATGLLGLMLGIVYLLSGRSLAPCIVAHFLINLAIEPGLVLAATRGEMTSDLR
jgi:hypothetical protein